MTKNAIGIFDSGIGGLSIWKEIIQVLPYQETIYLADSKNAPYGNKSEEEILKLSIKNTELLINKGCKLIIVACNTATTNAINYLTYDYSYSGFSTGHNDGFRIDISTNCGNSWDSIYGAFGPNLQTVPYVGNAWSPSCGSWISDSIDLTSFGLNGDTIMVRFAAVNDYGNNFYLDNINITAKILSSSDVDGVETKIVCLLG